MTRVLFLTPDLANNSTGRTYVLWRLARELGWETQVVASRGAAMWLPLRNTAFEGDSSVVAGAPDDLPAPLKADAERADVIIAVKPLAGSFDRGMVLSHELGIPLIVDIDDPELDVRLSAHSPLRAAAKAVLKRREYLSNRAFRESARRYPVIVSNPVLQRTYGGAIIPHAREDGGPGSEHASESPQIVFVGTARSHKGIGLLREAVAELADEGFTLTITDDAPDDAASWEHWTGSTTFEEGMALVGGGDIVVIPSDSSHPYSRGQLPAKVVDAMMSGRAVVASDVEPLVWALDGTGEIFRSGDRESLIATLRTLKDPSRRAAQGAAARERALGVFSIEACAPTLAAVVAAATAKS